MFDLTALCSVPQEKLIGKKKETLNVCLSFVGFVNLTSIWHGSSVNLSLLNSSLLSGSSFSWNAGSFGLLGGIGADIAATSGFAGSCGFAAGDVFPVDGAAASGVGVEGADCAAAAINYFAMYRLKPIKF